MKKILMLLLLILLVIILPSKSRKRIYKEYITYTKTMPQKCWLHRTNSLQKLEELSFKYPGIEIDISYDENKLIFDVGHELENSINLSLEKMFEKLDKDKKVWLDLKNLTEENSLIVLEKLEKLIMNYSLKKSNFIIESPDYKSLKKFKEKGFYTSYYDKFIPKNKTKEELKNWKENLIKIENGDYVCAFSFPNDLYPYYKEFNLKLDLLTWTSTKEWQLLYGKDKYRKILKDDQVKIILVKEYGKFHR